jgi:hypothetical protein
MSELDSKFDSVPQDVPYAIRKFQVERLNIIRGGNKLTDFRELSEIRLQTLIY